jgi:hypothetical protein
LIGDPCRFREKEETRMTSKKKRTYHRPEMERVRLVPEEAVLGGCKYTSGVQGALQIANCQTAGCFNVVAS